ncbi:hypothetical protein G6F68_012284 [Rhizopus microsporus]|nr:hypothetical protein G6F68_012284 [Rhizopus microsporus]
MSVLAFAAIPAFFQFVHRLDHEDGFLDGVGARARERRRRVLGVAVDQHLEPHGPDLGAHQHRQQRFGNECGIGAVAALQAGQRAVAGALFFHHGLQEHVGRRLQPYPAQRVQRRHAGDEARFHVTRAASVHPAVDDSGIVGVAAPLRPGPHGHHVDMAVQDQRPALAGARAVGAYHVERVVVRDGYRRETRHVLDGVDVDLPAVHVVAARRVLRRHEILCGRFFAALRGNSDQLRQRIGLVGIAVIDGRENARFQRLGQLGHGCSTVRDNAKDDRGNWR